MPKAQDLSPLETKTVVGLNMKLDLGRYNYGRVGSILALHSVFEQFSPEHNTKQLFFRVGLKTMFKVTELVELINSNNVKPFFMLKQDIRNFFIKRGDVPIDDIPLGAEWHEQNIYFGVTFNSQDLEEYRLEAYGDKLSDWMGDADVETLPFEFTPNPPTEDKIVEKEIVFVEKIEHSRHTHGFSGGSFRAYHFGMGGNPWIQ